LISSAIAAGANKPNSTVAIHSKAGHPEDRSILDKYIVAKRVEIVLVNTDLRYVKPLGSLNMI
jgi:hypothetical protein